MEHFAQRGDWDGLKADMAARSGPFTAAHSAVVAAPRPTGPTDCLAVVIDTQEASVRNLWAIEARLFGEDAKDAAVAAPEGHTNGMPLAWQANSAMGLAELINNRLAMILARL